MKVIAEEPKNALGHERPGTIKQVLADEKQARYFVAVFCNSPDKLSNPLEVKKSDISTITMHWGANKRVTISKIRAENGVFVAEKGYKIVPNLEVWTDRPNLDVTV